MVLLSWLFIWVKVISFIWLVVDKIVIFFVLFIELLYKLVVIVDLIGYKLNKWLINFEIIEIVIIFVKYKIINCYVKVEVNIFRFNNVILILVRIVVVKFLIIKLLNMIVVFL